MQDTPGVQTPTAAPSNRRRPPIWYGIPLTKRRRSRVHERHLDSCRHLPTGPPRCLRKEAHPDPLARHTGRQVYALHPTLRRRLSDHAHTRRPRTRSLDDVVHGLGTTACRCHHARRDTCLQRLPHRRDGRHSLLSARWHELRQGLPDLLHVHRTGGLGHPPLGQPPPRVPRRS